MPRGNRLTKTLAALVDTPAIGSVFAGNPYHDRVFFPRWMRPILIVGADLPISGEVLRY